MKIPVTRIIAIWAMLVGLGVFSLIIADAAFGKNNPRPVLDEAAAYVAGKPVNTYCQTDQTEWNDYLSSVWNLDGNWVNGYTMPWRDNTIYINPKTCYTLLFHLESEWRDPKLFGYALHTFIHEAVHQQGNGVYDEHLTDCIALTYTRDVAVRYFKVPEMETYTYTYLKYKWIKGRYKLVPAKIVKTEPSRFLRDAVFYAQVAHNIAPPPYSGECK